MNPFNSIIALITLEGKGLRKLAEFWILILAVSGCIGQYQSKIMPIHRVVVASTPGTELALFEEIPVVILPSHL